MRRWERIVIHHSGTPDTPELETAGFRKYHTEARGWRDIGYHFVVERAGDDWEILAGRPLHWSGAHTRGQNTRAIGICLAGNFSEGPPPAGQLTAAARFVAGLLDVLGLTPDEIRIHRHYASTECPGATFDLPFFRQLVEASL